MNVRKPFHRAYLFGMSVTRLYIPLYLWCYRNNFIASMGLDLMAYRPGLSASLVFWVSMQVVVLLLQDKFGPRFFVPDRFLPVRYRYDRPIPASLEEDHRSCVICMDEVEESSDYMLTPCNHLFLIPASSNPALLSSFHHPHLHQDCSPLQFSHQTAHVAQFLYILHMNQGNEGTVYLACSQGILGSHNAGR